MDINNIIDRAKSFEREAHKILGIHEMARSRVVQLEQTYRQLDMLSLKQDDLFRQALRCVEFGLFRAAYVMAWAAFMDFLEELAMLDNFKSILSIRPKWSISSLSDLREQFPESQIIDAMKEAKLLTKSDAKALQGLLNARNECAHPSGYCPDLNTTLGYISDLLKRLVTLNERHAKPVVP